MTKIVNFMLSAYYHNEQQNKDDYFIESTGSQEVSHLFRCLLFCEGGTLRKDLGIYREEDRTKKWTCALVSLAMEKV